MTWSPVAVAFAVHRPPAVSSAIPLAVFRALFSGHLRVLAVVEVAVVLATAVAAGTAAVLFGQVLELHVSSTVVNYLGGAQRLSAVQLFCPG